MFMNNVLLQVTVFTVDTSSALLERLESLQTRIIEGNVRLIILDSVAALARRVGTSKSIPAVYCCTSLVSPNIAEGLLGGKIKNDVVLFVCLL